MNERGSWQSAAYPVTGPSSQPAKWTMTTLHWPGGTINPNDPGGTLRAWQQSWVTGKGYSLGYNFCVFPDGSQWEVRGFDIACAANGSQQVNVPAIAINLCVPDVNTAPTAAMVEGVVDLIEQTRSRQPAAVIINGHRDVRPEPTSCPGEVIYQWITAGLFEPSGYVPPLEEDDMTEDQARQLAELHSALVSAQPGFAPPDGQGSLNAAWAALWGYQLVKANVLPMLDDLSRRVAELE